MKQEEIPADHWATEVVTKLNSYTRDSHRYYEALHEFWNLLNVELERDKGTGRYTLRTPTEAGTLARDVDPAFLGRLTETAMPMTFTVPHPRFFIGFLLGGAIKE